MIRSRSTFVEVSYEGLEGSLSGNTEKAMHMNKIR